MDEVQYLSVKSTGRSHLACHRCRSHKIKCSGEKPVCRNCSMVSKACEYPERGRIVTVNESDIVKLQARIRELEGTTRSNTPDVVLNENVFQTSGTTDSSLYSFLDIDLDQANAMRYYYKEQLTPDVPLPSMEYAVFLMERVLQFLGQEYYLLDQSNTVQEEVSRIYKTGEDVSYLFIIMAIGQQYMNEPSREETPGIYYFKMALKLFTPHYEEPTTKFIQELLLIAFYQQGLNRSNTAYAYYGLAIRSALVMGLHKRAPYLPLEEQERRRRLWWTCQCMDVIWTAKLGQPVHVDIDDITQPMDAYVDLQDGFKTDILRLSSELSKIIVFVMKTVYKPTTKKTISDLLKCLTKLSNFQQSLPEKMKSSIIMPNDRTTANLYLRLNQIMIISIRPLLLTTFMGQHTGDPQAIKKCVSAAASNITIIQQLREVGMFSQFGFWDARYLFSSLLVLYMTSGHETLVDVGRELNKAMCDSGNFTALENEIRLKELDSLFNKIRETSGREESTAELEAKSHSETSPNTLLLNTITNTFSLSPPRLEATTDGGFLESLQPLSSELPPDVWKSLTYNLSSWDAIN